MTIKIHGLTLLYSFCILLFGFWLARLGRSLWDDEVEYLPVWPPLSARDRKAEQSSHRWRYMNIFSKRLVYSSAHASATGDERGEHLIPGRQITMRAFIILFCSYGAAV